MIYLMCQNCGAKLKIAEDKAGREIRCRDCGEWIEVPTLEIDDFEERPPRRRRLQPHRGTTIMVLGILSLVTVPIILGPIAWAMGSSDLKLIRSGKMDPEGESQTNTGYICGMIGTILGIIGIVFACLFFGLMIAVLAFADRNAGNF